MGGNSPAEAKKIFDNILLDKADPMQKEVVIANAAFGIQVLEKGKDIQECIEIAKESIESGRAYQTLKKFMEINA